MTPPGPGAPARRERDPLVNMIFPPIKYCVLPTPQSPLPLTPYLAHDLARTRLKSKVREKMIYICNNRERKDASRKIYIFIELIEI